MRGKRDRFAAATSVALATTIAACGSDEVLRLELPFDDETRSAVVLLSRGDTVVAYAFEPSEERYTPPAIQRLTIPGDGEIGVTALLYANSLDVLRLEPTQL